MDILKEHKIKKDIDQETKNKFVKINCILYEDLENDYLERSKKQITFFLKDIIISFKNEINQFNKDVFFYQVVPFEPYYKEFFVYNQETETFTHKPHLKKLDIPQITKLILTNTQSSICFETSENKYQFSMNGLTMN